MKKIIDLTNRYIIVATPLLLFLFFLNIYIYTIIRSGQQPLISLGLILMFCMLIAFTAGWGNMLKSAISENNYAEPYLIIKDFVSGVGEYFIPTLGCYVIILLINSCLLIATYFAGMHFIGNIGISPDDFAKAMAGNEALKAFLTSLTTTQLFKLNLWNILIISVMSIFYFLVMLYPAALFLETKNPVKAIGLSLKHTFSKKFPSVLGIYLLIFSINFLISIFSALLARNSAISFVISLVNFYFICAAAIGIFYFYNKNFINSHLGNSIDTYI